MKRAEAIRAIVGPSDRAGYRCYHPRYRDRDRTLCSGYWLVWQAPLDLVAAMGVTDPRRGLLEGGRQRTPRASLDSGIGALALGTQQWWQLEPGASREGCAHHHQALEARGHVCHWAQTRYVAGFAALGYRLWTLDRDPLDPMALTQDGDLRGVLMPVRP